MKTFKCWKCKQVKPIHTSGSTGYGSYGKRNLKVCYECCAEDDRKYMDKHGKTTLYLSNGEVTNWPGTLRFPLWSSKRGRHNIAGTRKDVWFKDGSGNMWHGVQYGEFTQICHCKRLKSA